MTLRVSKFSLCKPPNIFARLGQSLLGPLLSPAVAKVDGYALANYHQCQSIETFIEFMPAIVSVLTRPRAHDQLQGLGESP